MAPLIQLIIGAQNQTGPAFAAVRGSLTGLGAQVTQSSTGLTGLASASGAAGGRVQVLSDRVHFQERALGILGTQLQSTTAKHGAASLQVQRAQLSYDRLTASIQHNRREMDRLSAQTPQVTRGFTGMGLGIGGVTGALGTFGIALGAQEIVRFGTDAVQAANSLEITQATVRALSGTTERYNEVLALGRSQQDLFGGSLQSALVGLQGLIPLAKNYNIALADLNTASQQLALSSPEQGIQGAAFAIREFLSASDATALRSLADRFELPKEALRDIKEGSSDTGEQVKALIELMNRQGFTAETLAARLQTDANAYTQLGRALRDTQDDIGGVLSRGFGPLARGATGLLTIFTDTRKGVELLAGAMAQAGGYGEKEAAARKASNLAWLEWLGIAPKATEATKNIAAPGSTGQPVGARAIAVPSPITVPAGFAPTATVAPVWSGAGPSGAAAPQYITNHHVIVNVGGSIRADQELAETVRRELQKMGRQNGSAGIP